MIYRLLKLLLLRSTEERKSTKNINFDYLGRPSIEKKKKRGKKESKKDHYESVRLQGGSEDEDF